MFRSFSIVFVRLLRRNAGERDSDLHVDGRLAQGDHRARQRGQPRRQEVSLSLGHCCGSGTPFNSDLDPHVWSFLIISQRTILVFFVKFSSFVTVTMKRLPFIS